MPGMHVHPLFLGAKEQNLPWILSLCMAHKHSAPPNFSSLLRPCCLELASPFTTHCTYRRRMAQWKFLPETFYLFNKSKLVKKKLRIQNLILFKISMHCKYLFLWAKNLVMFCSRADDYMYSEPSFLWSLCTIGKS